MISIHCPREHRLGKCISKFNRQPFVLGNIQNRVILKLETRARRITNNINVLQKHCRWTQFSEFLEFSDRLSKSAQISHRPFFVCLLKILPYLIKKGGIGLEARGVEILYQMLITRRQLCHRIPDRL